MAWWDGGGLLGGGSDPLDIYGDLFTTEQKAALAQRSAGEGLLKLAGAFGKAAQPSRLPTSFMGALGEAAGSLAGSGDQAAESALKAMKVGEDVRTSRQQREWTAKLLPSLIAKLRALEQANGLPQGSLTSQIPGAAAAPVAPGAPAVPPGGGDLGGSTGAPGTVGDFPTGAPQPQRPGMPPAPETLGYMQPAPGQPPPGMVPGAERFWPAPTTPDQIQPFPGAQQNTGLLPPPDQMVGPDGQPLTGPGVLPRLAAGGGAPPPFQLASSTPTGGVTRPAAGGGPRSQAIDYFTKQGWTPAQAAGIAANLEHESSWRPDVRGDGGQAFGYAQWHPPRQEQFKRVFGKDIRNATEQEQLAFVNWELNNTEKAAGDRLRTAASPRDAAAIVSKYYERPADVEGNAARRGALAEQIQGGGDYVIPSGHGVPAGALRTVADTGAAPSGAAGSVSNMPEQLSTLSAITQLLGLKDPFGSMLETYYKSPEYLREKARTEAQAAKDVALKMDPLIQTQTDIAKAKVEYEWKPKIEEAVQKLQSPILDERNKAKAAIDRYSKELELNQNAALTPTKATVFGPGGVVGTEEMTAYEFARRQKDRADRIIKGDTTFKPGDIVVAPTGGVPAEHEYIMTPQGGISARAVPGTPAAQKAAEAENKRIQSEQQRLIGRDVVVSEVENIKNEMANATLPTTGLIGSWLQNTGDTAANNVRVARQTIEARMSTDAINAMRAASPTGAALGNASDADLTILRTAIANLDQSQGKAQFLQRLDRVQQLYIDAVHGPGASRLLPETKVLKTPETTKPANEIIQNGWRYDATTHKPIGPVQ